MVGTREFSSPTSDRGPGANGDAPAGDAVGRLVGGRFRVDRVLGEGRHSPVYLAASMPLGRNVALRLVGAGVASEPALYDAFYAGVQAAGKLNHPALARVLDCGEEADGTLFLATEYVAGTSLRKLVEGADGVPMGAHRIAVVLHQVLSALAAAHDAGVVHRAISPDNILVVPSRTDDGAPTDLAKLCDLPMAALAELDDRGQCASGAFFRAGAARVRAASYLSPEQERGESVDARADLYALGAVLYELLTGAPPFADLDPAVRIVRRMTRAPSPPRGARGGGVDSTLARICLRALAPEPDGRYASAREMRHELRTLLVEDRSGRYVLRKNTSVAPAAAAPFVTSANTGSDPSGVSTVSLAAAAVTGRLERRAGERAGARGRARALASKRAKLRAELAAWTGPVACLAVLAAFITAAFVTAHPGTHDDASSASPASPGAEGAARNGPETQVLLPTNSAPSAVFDAVSPASIAAPDSGIAPRDSRLHAP